MATRVRLRIETTTEPPRAQGPAAVCRPTAPEATPHLPLWREAFAGLDWLALRTSAVYFGAGVPRGDGSPVVLVPGLFGTDAYLRELHCWLQRTGYRPYASAIGWNVECPRVMTERLVTTVERAHAETGSRVRLVGHSLGGLLARGAAMARAGLVAQVVTVGTPVNGVRVHPALFPAIHLLGPRCAGRCIGPLQGPLSSLTEEASVYSVDDGVVDPVTAEGPHSIPVRGTHVGLMFNPAVYRALGRLLAQPLAEAEREAYPRPAAEASGALAA